MSTGADTPPGGPEFAAAIERIEHEFSFLFARVRGTLRHRAERIDPAMAPQDYKILAAIVYRGDIQAGIIADQLMSDKSSVSRSVKVLESLGLIERHADPSDGRAHVLRATTEGERRLRRVREAENDLLVARLAAWDLADIQRLGFLLNQINDDYAGALHEAYATGPDTARCTPRDSPETGTIEG